MPHSITLEVSHPDITPGKIQGFRFLWAYYVKGYDPELHCQPCLRGSPIRQFNTVTAESGRIVVFDRIDKYPYLYICGVGTGHDKDLYLKNFHLPLRYVEGSSFDALTYNGYVFRINNASRIPIEPLPEGWEGKPKKHVRCKIFQFVVGQFGYPPQA